jgi:hypothetical protein
MRPDPGVDFAVDLGEVERATRELIPAPGLT